MPALVRNDGWQALSAPTAVIPLPGNRIQSVSLPHPSPSRPLSRDREAASVVFSSADALALRSRFALRVPGTAMAGVVGFSNSPWRGEPSPDPVSASARADALGSGSARSLAALVRNDGWQTLSAPTAVIPLPGNGIHSVSLPHPPPSRPLSRDRKAASAVFSFADASPVPVRAALARDGDGGCGGAFPILRHAGPRGRRAIARSGIRMSFAPPVEVRCSHRSR